jgi:hypothetical protein
MIVTTESLWLALLLTALVVLSLIVTQAVGAVRRLRRPQAEVR